MSDFNIINFSKQAYALKASDIHLLGDSVPMLRINGKIIKTKLPKLTDEELSGICKEILPPKYKDERNAIMDLDFAYEIPGVSRYRVNISRVFGHIKIVMRMIPLKIRTLEELGIPSSLEELTKLNNGLILVTGATGSGKSTTIAAMIDYINRTCNKHIVTVEDPIEFVFNSQKAAVSQRQIGIDTDSFLSGLKYSLRQDPDIIFIGEIRDTETISAALNAAETGHLVFSTLHTNGAVPTVNRIVNMFPAGSRDFVRAQLANVLVGVVSQKLIPTKEGNARIPAAEVMLSTSTIQDYIKKDELSQIYSVMKESTRIGMTTLNNSLYKLCQEDKITKEIASAYSDNDNELQQLFRGVDQH